MRSVSVVVPGIPVAVDEVPPLPHAPLELIVGVPHARVKHVEVYATTREPRRRTVNPVEREGALVEPV
jgi:hypothetical protein